MPHRHPHPPPAQAEEAARNHQYATARSRHAVTLCAPASVMRRTAIRRGDVVGTAEPTQQNRASVIHPCLTLGARTQRRISDHGGERSDGVVSRRGIRCRSQWLIPPGWPDRIKCAASHSFPAPTSPPYLECLPFPRFRQVPTQASNSMFCLLRRNRIRCSTLEREPHPT